MKLVRLMCFLIPLLPLIAEEVEKRTGNGGKCFMIFDYLIIASIFMLRASKVARWSLIDPGLFRSVLLYSILIFLSGFLTRAFQISSISDRGILLLIHTVLPYLWFLMGGIMLNSPAFHRRICMSYIAGTVVAAVWYMWSIRGMEKAGPVAFWTTVSMSSEINHNTLGLMFSIAVVLLLPIKMMQIRWLKPLVILLLITAVLLTFSRSSYVALLCAIVSLFFIQRNRRLFSVAFILAIAGIIFFSPFLQETVLERVHYTVARGDLDVSSQTRVLLWKSSLAAALRHPFFGIGFGKSLAEWDVTLGLSPSGLLFSHNYFLTLLSQLGLVGLFLGVYILIKGYRLSSRATLGDYGISVRLVLIAVVVASLFGEPLFWQGTLFITMILLSCVSNVYRS